MSTTDLNTPWSLHFDRDGTEDFGVICDAEGNQIAASHICGRDEWDTGTFWLPGPGDLTPRLLRQLRLMTAAPKLLDACKLALAGMEAELTADDPLAFTQMEWEAEPLATLRAVITEATSAEE